MRVQFRFDSLFRAFWRRGEGRGGIMCVSLQIGSWAFPSPKTIPDHSPLTPEPLSIVPNSLRVAELCPRFPDSGNPR